MSKSTRRLWIIGSIILATGVVGLIVVLDGEERPNGYRPRMRQVGAVANWWDPVPADLKAVAVETDARSNIARADYIGSGACSACHVKQFQAWSEHPHRWMNARAEALTVKGDFTGDASVSYMGGTASFFLDDSAFRMKLERGDVARTYAITQTIGSRFYQYYVGHLLEGPESAGHSSYSVDHVLPFGYWLDRKEWVPTVHVHWAKLDGQNVDEEDLPFDKRHDPFALPHDLFSFTPYTLCNQCHTTMPLGDLLVRNPDVLGRHAPLELHLAASSYLVETHPELELSASEVSDNQIQDVMKKAMAWDARDHAVNLGISCEACHLGARDHAEGNLKRPRFFPQSPHLYALTADGATQHETGRSHDNLNWACGRCHTGGRRLLAGGMATWNSTEYTDAMRGSCYTKLKCIDCHSPHEAIGKKWQLNPIEDDALCLKCHQELDPTEARQAHTHHAPDSAGSHCMDCHMPRLNEGLQDVVRTHMIFSPTENKMLEANQPNACNLCHVEKPIGWTLKQLSKWYGKQYSEAAIEANYPQQSEPTALGWLASKDYSVRLLAVDALSRSANRPSWAVSKMIDALDDPYLVNRQFARIGLEGRLNIRLSDYGYRYYMTRLERAEPIEKIRQKLTQ